MKPNNEIQKIPDSPFQVEHVALAEFTLSNRSLRRHPDAKLATLASNIKMFGFLVPVVVDEKGTILAGEARILAARRLGMETVPAVRVVHLIEAQSRAFRIADNRLVELSDWNTEVLQDEFREIIVLEPSFDLEFTGFDTAAPDQLLSLDFGEASLDPNDVVPELSLEAVSRVGDVWTIGNQRILCGDSKDKDAVIDLIGDQAVDLVLTDPPYNVPIIGHVRGSGNHAHREFAQGSGEMTGDEFETFLKDTLGLALDALRDGGLAYVYMDWRSIEILLRVGRSYGLQLINLAVWNKTNGGMGSLYRSKHELCVVWKKGRAPHTNNVQLGSKGRYRTNVWDYAGVNAFGHERDEALAIHPTVKPVAMMMDIIKDVTKRGDLVFDPFAGSGTTLLAAERTGRRCVGIELDPLYVDTIITRICGRLGIEAVHAPTGRTFDMVKMERERGDDPENVTDTSSDKGQDTGNTDIEKNDTYDLPVHRRRPPPLLVHSHSRASSDRRNTQASKKENVDG